MAAKVENRVLDLGLTVLDNESTAIYIVSSPEPTTYALATSGAGSLGFKSFGAGGCFGAPFAAADANGRRVSSTAITDGVVNASGTAAWWAVVDAATATLHAHGALSATQSIIAGQVFTLPSFDITVRAF